MEMKTSKRLRMLQSITFLFASRIQMYAVMKKIMHYYHYRRSQIKLDLFRMIFLPSTVHSKYDTFIVICVLNEHQINYKNILFISILRVTKCIQSGCYRSVCPRVQFIVATGRSVLITVLCDIFTTSAWNLRGSVLTRSRCCTPRCVVKVIR